MTYLDHVPAVLKLLDINPNIGKRRVALLLGVNVDTAQRTLAVARGQLGPYKAERLGFFDIEASNL